MDYKEIEMGPATPPPLVGDLTTHLRVIVAGHPCDDYLTQYKQLTCLHLIVRVPMYYYYACMLNLSVLRVSVEDGGFVDYCIVIRRMLNHLELSRNIKELCIERSTWLLPGCCTYVDIAMRNFLTNNESITSLTCSGYFIPEGSVHDIFANMNQNIKLAVLGINIEVSNWWASSVLPKLRYLTTLAFLCVRNPLVLDSIQFALSKLQALRVVKLKMNYAETRTACMHRLPSFILSARGLYELHVTYVESYEFDSDELEAIDNAMSKNRNIELHLPETEIFIDEHNRQHRRDREYHLEQWASAAILITAARTRDSFYLQLLPLLPTIIGLADFKHHKDASVNRLAETTYFKHMLSNKKRKHI